MSRDVRPASPQVALSDRTLTLDGRRASTAINITLPGGEDLILAVDIYGFQPQTHPVNHLGWWHFNPGRGTSSLQLDFDFNRIGSRSVRLFKNGAELASPNGWFNPAYILKPLQECKLVVWNAKNEILALDRLLIKIDEPRVIAAFVQEQNKSEGWAPELPFLDLLHHFKLKVLGRWFGRYFRGTVLDVGCGLSLFTALSKKFPFTIVAGDLSFDRIRACQARHPGITWLVFDAAHPPFRDGSFDGLFAGEILEHLPDPESALAEWNRVQNKGGMLILTTPNRRRRINVLNKEDWPFSPDHLREFSFDELNGSLLPQAGYRTVKTKGVYLEAWIRSGRWRKEDYLQREGNTRSNRRLMQVLFRLGYWLPRKALDLITAARKT